MANQSDLLSGASEEDELPFVSVVMPVYNDAGRLRLCIDAIIAQDYPRERFEVIVVDNNSDDNPVRVIPDLPGYQLLRESRQGSYAARNAGVQSTRGEILAFTDSDCIPNFDWLTRGAAAMLREPTPDAVGGAIRIFFEHGSAPRSGPEHFEAINEFQQKKYVQEWSFAATANLFVNATILESIGRFNPALQSGGDLDFGTRLTRAGGRLVYDDDVVVHHPARSSWGALGVKTLRVANGIADKTVDDGRRGSLHRAWREGRGGITIWFRVWNGSRPAPQRPIDKLRYASAFSYVRLLRTAVHLRRAARRPQR